jgi:asparagine synthase (glutamine-hydrolysing)
MAGHQPMKSYDGRYWIIFNGEIYNYVELKRFLMAKGYSFQSRSDTEVLLNLFIEEGKDCLQKLNGMFAFTIWDTQERRIFLARDRWVLNPSIGIAVRKCSCLHRKSKRFFNRRM